MKRITITDKSRFDEQKKRLKNQLKMVEQYNKKKNNKDPSTINRIE